MAKVIKTENGRVIRGRIILNIDVELEDGDDREDIPDNEAKELLMQRQDELSGSNDGSELLANAKVILVDE